MKQTTNLEGKVGGHIVWRQEWLESERGWGVRPDGYSLHLTDADVSAFVRDYWETMPNTAPDEYSRPSGDPYTTLVDNDMYQRIKESRNGIRR